MKALAEILGVDTRWGRRAWLYYLVALIPLAVVNTTIDTPPVLAIALYAAVYAAIRLATDPHRGPNRKDKRG